MLAGLVSDDRWLPICGEIWAIAGLMTPFARLTLSVPRREFSSNCTAAVAGGVAPGVLTPAARSTERVSGAGTTSVA